MLLSSQAEQSATELAGAQNKLTAEMADLRAAAANMSRINEALALDKVQLNKLVLQVSRVAKDLARCLPPAAASSQSAAFRQCDWLTMATFFLFVCKPNLWQSNSCCI